MAIREVKLEDDEWQQVMNALIAQNPLLMKVAAQLREQQQPPPVPDGFQKGVRRDGGKEVGHESDR